MKFNKVFANVIKILNISLLILCGSLYLECTSVYAAESLLQPFCDGTLSGEPVLCPGGGASVGGTYIGGSVICPDGMQVVDTLCCCPIEKFPKPVTPVTE